MAMRETVRNIEAVQNTALILKQEKEKERKKKQTQKENIKRLDYNLKKYLRNEFERFIFDLGSDYATEFYLIERKNSILEDIKNNDEIMTRKTFYDGIPTHELWQLKFLEENYNKYYYKILKEVTREKLEDEKASFWKLCNEVETIPAEKKEINLQPIIKIIGIIFLFPIIAIIALFYGVLKNNK